MTSPPPPTTIWHSEPVYVYRESWVYHRREPWINGKPWRHNMACGLPADGNSTGWKPDPPWRIPHAIIKQIPHTRPCKKCWT